MQQQMTPILKLPRLLPGFRLPKLHPPLALLFLPVAAHDLRVERHVLAQVERVAHFVQVGPDVGRAGEEARPVGVESELVGVGVRGDVAGAAGVPVLQPRPCAIVNIYRLRVRHLDTHRRCPRSSRK